MGPKVKKTEEEKVAEKAAKEEAKKAKAKDKKAPAKKDKTEEEVVDNATKSTKADDESNASPNKDGKARKLEDGAKEEGSSRAKRNKKVSKEAEKDADGLDVDDEEDGELDGEDDEDFKEDGGEKKEKTEEEKEKTKKRTKAGKPAEEKKVADKKGGDKKAPVKKDDGKLKMGAAKDEKKKDKFVQMSVDDSKLKIEAFMIKNNRPYSCQDVLNHFQESMRRKNADEALDQLVDDKILSLKEYGKAKVFLINQDRFPEVDTSLLETLDEQINVRREEFNKLIEDNKSLTKQFAEATSTQTNTELKAIIERLTRENKENAERVVQFRSGGIELVSED
jgi:26S proteasome regulatory subunit (ATPase 3-interacting protein)